MLLSVHFRRVALLLAALCMGWAIALAQVQSYGPIRYQLPEGFVAEQRTDRRIFIRDDKSTGGYCAIHLFAAMPSSGDARADFDHFWRQTMVQPYGALASPEVSSESQEGWTVHAAAATVKDQGFDYACLLTVVSGHGRAVLIQTFYDNEKYVEVISAFMHGLDIKKDPAALVPAPSAPSAPPTPAQSAQAQRPSAPAMGQAPSSATAIKGHSGTVYTANGIRREVMPDWVQLTSDNITVWLHYTVPIGAGGVSHTDGDGWEDALWRRFVLPYFEPTGPVEMPYRNTIGKMGLPELAQGPARQRATGAEGYVAMIAHPENGTYSPVVAFGPSREALEKVFEKIENAYFAQKHNYFPLDQQRLQGTWSEAGGATNNYYSTATGLYVGSAGAVSSTKYAFGPGTSYTAEFKGAVGMVGAMQTYQQKESGTFSLDGPHVMTTRPQKGDATTFDAGLIAVRGGWMLQIINQQATGLKYRLVRVK